MLFRSGTDGTTLASSDNEMKWSDGFTSVPSWTCPSDGTYYAKISQGYGQIGEYNLQIAEIPPGRDVHIAVAPGTADPCQTFRLSWDEVPEADLYQIWVSFVYGEELDGPYNLFDEGEELRPADCTLSGSRLSYETPAWFSPGDNAFVQISWSVDGIWSVMSTGTEGSTETETSIGVVIR